MIYKIGNNQITSPFNLTRIDQVHNYNTRLSKSHNYRNNLPKTRLGQSAFSTEGAKIWREVPQEIKMSSSQFLFKSKIKYHLIKEY